MEFEIFNENNSIIKVLGVGGGGCNAINHMFQHGIDGVNFAVCNTDYQDLQKSPVPTKIQLGKELLEGLGAGADPEEGRRAALEAEDEIRMYLSNNTKMVFVTAGMGGGTGTGGAPVIAKISKDLGILTVGIVTIPFSNEGKPKRDKADKGIQSLKENVDALIVISNNKLYEFYPDLGIREAFSKADDILSIAARGVTEIITKTGDMNVDFNDVKRVMQNSGVAIIGIGTGSGENRAAGAIHAAINSPLLEDADILGAKGVVLNISYGDDFKMKELDLIIKTVQDETQTDCEVIWGVCKDDTLGEDIAITLIATGFESGEGKREKRRMVQQQQNKIVHTLDNTNTKNQEESISNNVVEEKLIVDNIEYKPKTDYLNIELEIENNTQNTEDIFEIKIVDKPRISIDNNNEQTNQSQFNLFSAEDIANTSNQKIIEEQHLERDLIKKRISLEMQKNEVNLHELEKEPAYKRYGINLEEEKPAEKSEISNYVIYQNFEENKVEIKPNAMKDISLD
jgi:cell division protein FtsZ